jgi:hypothetical protein
MKLCERESRQFLESGFIPLKNTFRVVVLWSLEIS